MSFLTAKIKQPQALLNHLLGEPELPAIVKKLDFGVLVRLIHHVGLEDAGQIVSLATTEQLSNIFDEDLWRSRSPGQAETFDAARFGLWLEVMLEAGAASAARKIAALDENLVSLGLGRLIWVAGKGDMAMGFENGWHPEKDHSLERALAGSLSMEFEGFLIFSKDQTHWDAVCAFLAELSEMDHELFTQLMERCRQITIADVEDNGGSLGLFSDGEMLEEDAASEREERREGQGFVTSLSAALFLGRARSTPLRKIIEKHKMDYATRVYTDASRSNPSAGPATQTEDILKQKQDTDAVTRKVTELMQVLRDADVLPRPDARLLGYGDAESGRHHLPLVNAMGHIRRTGGGFYEQLMLEFSYLSNTLVSGCAFNGTTFSPKQAAEAAFSVCNLGCEVLMKTDLSRKDRQPVKTMAILLEERGLVKLFQVGWKILYDNVAVYAAKSLLAFLKTLKAKQMDLEQMHDVRQMIRLLQNCLTSGRPWDFDDHMDDLMVFVAGETVSAVSGLIQEYPTLSEVICELGCHRVSPFISSRAHIRTIRQYLSAEL